jgi:hypothetical protein
VPHAASSFFHSVLKNEFSAATLAALALFLAASAASSSDRAMFFSRRSFADFCIRTWALAAFAFLHAAVLGMQRPDGEPDRSLKKTAQSEECFGRQIRRAAFSMASEWLAGEAEGAAL